MKLVFFDRDGVINKRLFGDYVKETNQFIFNDGFFELFSNLKRDEYITTVVTNQQGVGKKIMTELDLINLHNFMQEQLISNTNHSFDLIKYCTALATENNRRRKPELEMFVEILDELKFDYNFLNHLSPDHLTSNNISPNQLFTIGDSVTDIIPGNIIGSTTIFIGTETTLEQEYKNKSSELDIVFERFSKIYSHISQSKSLNFENYYKPNYTFENINQLLLSYNDIFIL